MATTTRRYLVIANQTLAEAELTEAIRQRLEQGPSSFYLLVPNTKAADLAARIARGAPIAPAAGDATVDALATEHAQHRLGQLLDDLRGMDADVDGDIGDPDPIAAVDRCWSVSSSTRSSSPPCPSPSRNGWGWTSRTGCTAIRGCR